MSKSVSERSGHTPRKRFGQNFLTDAFVIDQIIAAVQPQPGQHLVEIGPGLGAITRPLLAAAGRLDAVELDRDLIEKLQKRCQDRGELTLHNADALAFDFRRLRDERGPLRVVGNLPYNISTPLLFHLLDQAAQIGDMHFMLQKEVVERLAAGADDDAYGRLSVMVQYRCRVEPLFIIGPESFDPPPKVESAFVRLIPYPAPPLPAHDEHRFARLVQQAFTQRRKMLRKSLHGLLSPEAIAATGIDPQARPETLTLADFVALSNVSDRP